VPEQLLQRREVQSGELEQPADYVGALSGVAKHVKVPSRHRLVEEGSKADRFWLIQARQVALDMQVPAAAGGHRGAGHGRHHWLVLRARATSEALPPPRMVW
jgi:hypothetical protein